jgi:hypothetical protein
MFKRLLPLIPVLLTACASPPSPESLKNLYEVEPVARQMKPQSDLAVLYLLATEGKPGGTQTALLINGEISMKQVRMDENFYVFCLTPGKYDITYRGDFLVQNKNEFLIAEPGAVYIRDFNQYVAALPPIFIFTGSKLQDVDLVAAKQVIAHRRIGTELEYANSRYRCRSLI